ncbi:MAG: electron transfer flavoprotein subunit alpha/FixB family protein [Candidatus Gastranaerophilales bacterium]|nr:electron transfer flavoprotein subunit alpha/FixB family protein [Candidatus Gastranaerophilales bacterium]
MKKITVYCEVDSSEKKLENVSYELISKAYDLAQSAMQMQTDEYIVEAVALCDEIREESVKKAFMAGANKFVLIQDKCLENFSQAVFAQCFIEYFRENRSDVIIFPATIKGRIVAPRITTLLDTGLVADCTGLEFIVKDNQLKFAPTRPTFGSELMATIISKKDPQCATVRPKTFKAQFDRNIDGELNVFNPNSYEEPRVKLLRTVLDNSSSVGDFSDTRIVLAAGYGLVDKKDRKYFTRLERLAQLVGAKVGSTRKVVEMGFMPAATQIGLTGATVEPELYIAFGISGAIQHVSGMKNSKTVIAINTDRNADIFKYSDYEIVADAKVLIDELLEKLG